MMLFKLLSGMCAKQNEAAVISLMDNGTLGERIDTIGVPVFSLNMMRGLPSFSALWRLRKTTRKIEPSVIQGWMYHGNLAAKLSRFFCVSKPLVVWNIRHSLYDIRHERPLTRWVIRANALLSKQADAIIYNSFTSARQHEELGFDPTKKRIIPNGFDTDVFRPDEISRAAIRCELGINENATLIGLIGRYHPMKDHRNFLNAASLLQKNLHEAYFLLAGREADSENMELQTMIRELGICDRVFLLGERQDIPQLNAALDIACCCSSWGDAFPNVVGEAMACGVPCVVTDVGDSAWIVGNTGRVVTPKNPQALATAWKELIELGCDNRRELGMQARKRVIDKFSLESVVKQYKEVYESITL